jgi:hypothetical protein
MAICLLDSTVIIDAINDRNGHNELLEGLIAEGTLFACCSINITEVHMGIVLTRLKERRSFSQAWSIIP